jgi:ABC-type transport system involved in multi-copper enzyme maturation permease subunit
MKYLALLRDSFRESLDNKMIYFTVGLSLVVVFIIASFDFRFMTAEDQAKGVVDSLNFFYWSQEQLEQEKSKVELTECRQLNPEAEPWDGNYHIVITAHLAKTAAEGDKSKIYRDLGRELLRKDFWWMNKRVIKEEVSKDNRTLRFIITSEGTKLDSRKSWKHDPGALFGLIRASSMPLFGSLYFQSTLAYSVYWVEDAIVNNFGAWAIILIGIIITAFIVPNMMEKGSIDLLLVKPIARPMLLLIKYIGGLTFVFINSVVAIGGIWLVIGLRTGLWTWSFLLTIFIITFFFAILYSVSVLFGVVTRNSLISILMTIVVWLILFLVGFGYSQYEQIFSKDRPAGRGNAGDQAVQTRRSATPEEPLPWLGTSLRIAHAILPRTNDLGWITTNLLSHELLSESERRQFGFDSYQPASVVETVGVSLAFIAVILGLACWRFTARDY